MAVSCAPSQGMGEHWREVILLLAAKPLCGVAAASPHTLNPFHPFYLSPISETSQTEQTIERLRVEIPRAVHEQHLLGGQKSSYRQSQHPYIIQACLRFQLLIPVALSPMIRRINP